MLLDTPSLYFRAFFGIPESIKAPDGSPVNAVRGLIDMIATLVRQHQPAALAATMDADWRPAFRVAAIPTYKAHRVAHGDTEEVPEALVPQIAVIQDVLDALGIARLESPGYEADDVIGTLTHQAGDGAVDIVTGDRDLFQLVDDSRPVRVLYTARGIRNLQIVDEAFVTAKYGVPGRAYADFATLRGDPSDGLPGVPGVGEKTAAALITRFGSLPALLEALDAGVTDGFPAGSRTRLAAARDYLAAAPAVVKVAPDAPLPDVDLTLPAKPRDPEALVRLADRYGLDSPLNRLLDALGR
ncbi:DNA polymerase I [[Actinomadura] parvosata subsp. kistnae]|uniref:5'-3' exonuclease n=1 Tax=[Actinomadura] parvosata subsp. kistnae TaxID=1909395 RepID=A0A1V0AKB0_9ACTN|nr:5'-3' exonuclease [Nonomuraea sp. ATCC 55076]AQZ70609.1 flap endonuclease [Nonomuraea sp. ATCC 55076]SPL89964.1 DNA polymerase I [Actinomadura parvosata subsp. kistnae]